MTSSRFVVAAALVTVFWYGSVGPVRAADGGAKLELERHRRTMARYETMRDQGANVAVVERLMASERQRHAAATGSQKPQALRTLDEAIDAANADCAVGGDEAIEPEASVRGPVFDDASLEAVLEAAPTRSAARLPYGNAGVIAQKNGHVMCYIGANYMCCRCGARGNPGFPCKGSHELHLYGNEIRCRTCDRKWTPSTSLNSKCTGKHDIHIVGMRRSCIKCGRCANLSTTPCKK